MARLSPGQRACLDLVDDHATSKEIALALGISRHTVDARLRQAMRVLGVSSRREAAIIWRASALARAEGRAGEAYQPFAYQSSRIESRLGTPDGLAHGPALEPLGLHGEELPGDPSADCGGDAGRNAGRDPGDALGRAGISHHVRQVSLPLMQGGPAGEPAPEVADAAAWTWPASHAPASALRLWGGANDLTLPQRLAGILIVTILAMLAFGLLLSGIAALTQLRT